MRFFILLFIPSLLVAQSQPIELGDVHWLRSMDEARKQSSEQHKPILILFQEVPGCQTCKSYGNDVLKQSLIVEAIETYFIPLAIYNNKGGHDAEVLKQYDEPSWNNPVVRIVDQSGTDLLSRLSGNYSAAGLADFMRLALMRAEVRTPHFLKLLADELIARLRGTETVTYSMFCFWTGEALFGKFNGVVKTTAAFQGGKEVVVVEFDPLVITRATLDKIALSESCHAESNGDARPDSTPKYYLSRSKYSKIYLTETQKCRVNSALAEGQSPDEFLSPRQLQMRK